MMELSDKNQVTEDLLASTVVSEVLERSISQLAISERGPQGDAYLKGSTGRQAETDACETSNHGDTNQSLSSSNQSRDAIELEKSASEEITQDGNHQGKTSDLDEYQQQFGQNDTMKDIPPGDQNTLGKVDDQVTRVDRELSSLSSKVLEIHIPQNVVNTAEGVDNGYSEHPVRDTLPHVSQSYPPAHPSQQDHQSPNQATRSSSRVIQFPQTKLLSSSGSRKNVFITTARQRKLREMVSQRQRVPPCVTRMSAVLMNTRARAEKQRMISTYFEERSRRKILTLDQCINSRPPMPFDLDNPGPCRYTPSNKPPSETNSPRYTFGHKFPGRAGGGRTAWSKSWFNSQDGQTIKVDFEDRWPSPASHSGSRSLVGRKLPSRPTYPSYTIGVRSKFSINKRGSDKEPSPNEYDPSMADRVLYHKAPAFTMAFRHKGTSLWPSSERTPAPDIYTPRLASMSSKTHRPAFTIQGIRRPKSHALGPYATF